MGYALHIQGMYMYMSGIFREIAFHYFHGESCCVEKLCLLHSIALNHGMGFLHWNSKKYIKLEFWYTWHIHSIYHVYTVALHIHGIYLAYTDYIPHRGSRCWYQPGVQYLILIDWRLCFWYQIMYASILKHPEVKKFYIKVVYYYIEAPYIEEY